jgi:cell division protein FtsN
MTSVDRHLVVIGCGLAATALLVFAGGAVTTLWLVRAPAVSMPSVPVPAAGTEALAPVGPAPPEAAAAAAEDPPAISAPASGARGSVSEPAPLLPAPAGAAMFSLRFGSFLDPQAAGTVAAQLAARGYPVSVAAWPDGAGLVWHAPQVGSFADHREAVGAARDVAQRVGLTARVVRLPAGAAG